jgi:hypothetical protein
LDTTQTPFNRDLIVRFLLGELPPEEQVEIEDRAFQNQEYLENIVVVEDDLIDSYVRGEIAAGQRRAFEDKFFSSESRRKKVEFARALAKVTSEESTAVERAPVFVPQIKRENNLLAFFRSLRPVPALSFAVIALLILVGGIWLIPETLRLRSELARLRGEQQSREAQEKNLQEQIARERKRSEELAAQLQQEQQRGPDKSVPAEGQKTVEPPSFVSLILGPGISRGSNNKAKLTIPAGVRTAQLHVGVDPLDVYQSFRVEIRSQQGKTVLTRDKLQARGGKAGRAVLVVVPAAVLSPGSYEVSLKGVTDQGKVEDVGFYYFDVAKK